MGLDRPILFCQGPQRFMDSGVMDASHSSAKNKTPEGVRLSKKESKNQFGVVRN